MCGKLNITYIGNRGAVENEKVEKKKKKQEEEGNCERHYVYYRGGKNIYCSEGSQAVPARPSGKGTLETKKSRGK